MLTTNKIKILFFIGSLRAGGKERRLVELLTYLKEKGLYDILLVVTRDEIHYPTFEKLQVGYYVINKKRKKNDFTLFFQFYKICKQFKPQLIHVWGRMQAFYTLPSVINLQIPLVNSQITSAPPKNRKWALLNLIDRINFRFSNVILSNSMAGIESFRPPISKSKVIYNGLNQNRFEALPSVESVRLKYKILTPKVVVMTASFTPNKNYDLFYRVAKRVTAMRSDVSFLGVGGYDQDDSIYKRLCSQCANNLNILFPGPSINIESIVNASDIGVLFSPNGEGISNSILEYMALGKPVIASDLGGNRELITNHVNGYLVNDDCEEIVNLINRLLDDVGICRRFGEASRQKIQESFMLNKMGLEFENVYNNCLNRKTHLTPTLALLENTDVLMSGTLKK